MHEGCRLAVHAGHGVGSGRPPGSQKATSQEWQTQEYCCKAQSGRCCIRVMECLASEIITGGAWPACALSPCVHMLLTARMLQASAPPEGPMLPAPGVVVQCVMTSSSEGSSDESIEMRTAFTHGPQATMPAPCQPCHGLDRPA